MRYISVYNGAINISTFLSQGVASRLSREGFCLPYGGGAIPAHITRFKSTHLSESQREKRKREKEVALVKNLNCLRGRDPTASHALKVQGTRVPLHCRQKGSFRFYWVWCLPSDPRATARPLPCRPGAQPANSAAGLCNWKRAKGSA